jgi:rubrerythrin
MIAALRAAVYEALKREEETFNMYTRFSNEAKDQILRDFFRSLAQDVKTDIETMKRLDLHSIVKFGLAIKFQVSKCRIDERTAKSIKDVAGAKELLKVAIDEINADIEYYNHISEHSIFPEVNRLFRIIGDKELDHKCKLKALTDLLA